MKIKPLLFVILAGTFLLGISGVQKARALPDVYAVSFYVFGDFFPGSTTTFTISYGYSGIYQARLTSLEVSGDLGTFPSPNSFPVILNPADVKDVSFQAQMPTTATPGDHSLLVSATYDDYDPSYGWVTSPTPASYRQSFTMTRAPQSPNPQPTPSPGPGNGNPGVAPQPASFPWEYLILGLVAVAGVGYFVFTKRETLGIGTRPTGQTPPNLVVPGVQPVYFCSNCGKQNPSTSRFCEFCGTPSDQ